MIEINGVKIGPEFPPYIIAELSANHSGSLTRAKASISKAKSIGVDAVKIQTYTPETMTIDSAKPDFMVSDGLWAGKTLFQLYEEAHTPYEWHGELFRHAHSVGVTLFSTPFDETAVDLLVELGCPAFKIASFELTDIPLISYAASFQRPMLISTGMASFDEIEAALKACQEQNNSKVLLFHCVSSYPAPFNQLNLNNVKFLSENFDVDVGLSDHTIGNLASALSIGLGACAIEKHFKLDEKESSPDALFSLLPKQFEQLVADCKAAKIALGRGCLNRSSEEEKNKKFRRSIYFSNSLACGEPITEDDIRRIRPGFGLEPRYFSQIIGKKVTKAVERGDPVTWSCLE